jgi:hypothetical protein
MIAEFNKHWEEEYKIKTAAALQSVIDKRNAHNEKNVKTVRVDRNAAADMEEVGVSGDVVKQAEGDTEYVTSSLVLTFIHTYMKSLAEDGSIKQTWFGPGNPRREFPVTVCHQPMNPSKQHA